MKVWVKLYTEIVDDPDQDSLTWAQRGVWVALLALAGKLDHRDKKENETGRLDTFERVKWFLRCEDGILKDAIETFKERGMLKEDADQVLWLPNYGKRQRTRPSAKRGNVLARVRKHRAAKKQVCNADVTALQDECNAGVTRPRSRLEENRIDLDKKKVKSKGMSGPENRPDPSPPIVLTEEEAKCWEILNTVPLFPDRTLPRVEALRRYIADFPEIDPVALCQNFAAYKVDKPLTKKSNPMSQVRTSFEMARKFGKQLRPPTDGKGYSSQPDADAWLEKKKAEREARRAGRGDA